MGYALAGSLIFINKITMLFIKTGLFIKKVLTEVLKTRKLI